jgi:hypothetical protein
MNRGDRVATASNLSGAVRVRRRSSGGRGGRTTNGQIA